MILWISPFHLPDYWSESCSIFFSQLVCYFLLRNLYIKCYGRFLVPSLFFHSNDWVLIDFNLWLYMMIKALLFHKWLNFPLILKMSVNYNTVLFFFLITDSKLVTGRQKRKDNNISKKFFFFCLWLFHCFHNIFLFLCVSENIIILIFLSGT